jgi:hypothetical protein
MLVGWLAVSAIKALFAPADPKYARCDALETAGGVIIGLGSCLALLAIGAFWCLVAVAVARVALG